MSGSTKDGPSKEKKSGLKESWSLLRRLSRYVENDWYLIVLSVLGQIGNSATTLSFPWLIGMAQDKAGRGHTFSQFKDFMLGGSAVLAVASLSSLLRIYCCGYATDRISTRLKKALYGSYLDQDIQYFDEAKSGELLTILDKDVNEASELFTEQVIGFMRAFNSSVNGSIMLYLVSPKLCGITLACVPFVGIGGTFMFMNNHKKKKSMRAIEVSTMDYVVERVHSISTVRLNGKEDFERNKYANFMQNKLALSKSVHSAQGLFMSFTNICTNVCLGVLLGVGGGMVGRGEITAGDLSKFAMQSAFVGLGFSSLVKVYGSIRSAIASCSRVFETMDTCIAHATSTLSPSSGTLDGNYLIEDSPAIEKILPKESSSSDEWESTNDALGQSCEIVDMSGLHSSEQETYAIILQDVHFSYKSRPEKEVLRGISLRIPDKTLTVIVGKNGAGKSTLHKLMCGLYPPSKGHIVIANKSTKAEDLEWIRSKVGVVEQSARLLSGTIAENICYGTTKSQGTVSQETIEEAARAVNAHQFISSFPKGYETEVGEGGQLLSGGQRARVALARALLKHPSVLVLDEPSAALDTESEACLVDLLRKFKQEKCVVVFTHSEAIMAIADCVHLIDNGQVAVSGPYAALVGSCKADTELAISAALSAVSADCASASGTKK